MPSQSDPTAQTLLGHLTDTKGAHELSDLTVDGVPADAAFAAQYAPRPAVDGTVGQALKIASINPLVSEWGDDEGGSAIVFNVRDYGAVGDNVTNDAAAFQAAFNAANDAGGGTVYVPASTNHYFINTAVNASSLRFIRFIGAGASIRIKVGSGLSGIAFSNSVNVEIAGIRFVGTIAETYDALRVLSLTSVSKVSIHDCGFDGLLAQSGANAGVIYADTSRLHLYDNRFGGCGGHVSPFVPVVHVRQNSDFVAERNHFFDAAGDGVFTSPRNQAGAWIGVYDAVALSNAFNQGAVSIRHCQFDEGAQWGIRIDGVANRYRHVYVHGCRSNAASGSGGYKFNQVELLQMSHSFVGYNAGSVAPGVDLSEIAVARLDGVIATANSNIIQAASSVGYLELEDCVYTTLTSSATDTRVTSGKLASGNSLLAMTTLGPGVGAASFDNATDTLTRLHPTTLATAVSFTAQTSSVIVRCQTMARHTVLGGIMIYGLIDTTSAATISGSEQAVAEVLVANTRHKTGYTARITGLTPGTTYTWALAQRNGGSGTLSTWVGANNGITMEVWSA